MMASLWLAENDFDQDVTLDEKPWPQRSIASWHRLAPKQATSELSFAEPVWLQYCPLGSRVRNGVSKLSTLEAHPGQACFVAFVWHFFICFASQGEQLFGHWMCSQHTILTQVSKEPRLSRLLVRRDRHLRLVVAPIPRSLRLWTFARWTHTLQPNPRGRMAKKDRPSDPDPWCDMGVVC